MYKWPGLWYDVFMVALIVTLCVVAAVLAVLSVVMFVLHRANSGRDIVPTPLTGAVRPPNDEQQE